MDPPFLKSAEETLGFLRSVLASEINADADCRIESDLLLQRTRLRWLPGNLTVGGNLVLSGCQRFRGFKGDSLVVEGNLAIGGKSLEPVWVGDRGSIGSRYGRRVADFLRNPSTQFSCPFTQWPETVEVKGDLSLVNCTECHELPKRLVVGRSLVLIKCGVESLPDELVVKGDLIIDACPINKLPEKLVVAGDLHLRNLSIEKLPEELSVGLALKLARCNSLKKIPSRISVGEVLDVTSCAIETVERGFSVRDRIEFRNCPIEEFMLERGQCEQLSFRNCNQLRQIKREGMGSIELVVLMINQCELFDTLPEELRVAATCRLANLPSLKTLPKRFQSKRAIEISGTKLESVDESQMSELSFRYRGVPIPAYALFEPHRIRDEDVLEPRNAEVRRMMLEQMGVEKFEKQVARLVIDQDVDPGGKRSLIRYLPSQRWNQRVYLMCRCPSTERVYLLQVPPSISTCHAAAAWLAGFENPEEYTPQIET